MEYKYINIDDEEISFTHDDIFIVFITPDSSTYILFINDNGYVVYDIKNEIFDDIIQQDFISLLDINNDGNDDYDYYNINSITELHGYNKYSNIYMYTISNSDKSKTIVRYEKDIMYKKIVAAFYKNRELKIEELLK